ncbi:hypothetical protein [uncultured Paludibaculum sp.]|uniref:hypothetical protein n=1 Tax=uncultured Paludibaculum sp. TaxID=1765020 RepID=UPI002AAB22CE|nr:hypothetical protein [uncultured Paludibaculum sp.]
MIRLPTVVIDRKMQGMCRLPYPNHARGCPNFGLKVGCPPNVPLFPEVYDMTKPVYAIVNRFDFGAHVAKMRAAHPDWTDRQLTCCLYWQGTARKALKRAIADFERLFPDHTVDTCPEAKGVNVTATLQAVGINLEWPPQAVACQVALAGVLL